MATNQESTTNETSNRLKSIEDELKNINKRFDELFDTIKESERTYTVISSDIQTSMEALSTFVNTCSMLNQNGQKEITDTPGVKADGTLAPEKNNVNTIPEKQTIKFPNIKEFFKQQFVEDEEFEKEFTSEEGEQAYNAYLEKPASKKKKPDELKKARANAHYTALTQEKKNRVKEIKKEKEQNIELKKKQETPTLSKDEF